MIGVSADSLRCRISLRGLVAVERRHPHVHEDHREVLAQDGAQRGASRVGLDDEVAQRREHRPHREPLGGVVVDDEDGGLPAVAVRRLGGRVAVAISRALPVGRPAAAAPASHSARIGRKSAAVLDGLGDVRGGARVDAALALPGADLGGDGDDRELRAPRQLAHRPDRRVAVHDRHHDVHEHDVDVGRALERSRAPSSPPSAETTSSLPRSSSVVRAKMLRMSSSIDQRLHARQRRPERAWRRAAPPARAAAPRASQRRRRGRRGPGADGR